MFIPPRLQAIGAPQAGAGKRNPAHQPEQIEGQPQHQGGNAVPQGHRKAHSEKRNACKGRKSPELASSYSLYFRQQPAPLNLPPARQKLTRCRPRPCRINRLKVHLRLREGSVRRDHEFDHDRRAVARFVERSQVRSKAPPAAWGRCGPRCRRWWFARQRADRWACSSPRGSRRRQSPPVRGSRRRRARRLRSGRDRAKCRCRWTTTAGRASRAARLTEQRLGNRRSAAICSAVPGGKSGANPS